MLTLTEISNGISLVFSGVSLVTNGISMVGPYINGSVMVSYGVWSVVDGNSTVFTYSCMVSEW